MENVVHIPSKYDNDEEPAVEVNQGKRKEYKMKLLQSTDNQIICFCHSQIKVMALPNCQAPKRFSIKEESNIKCVLQLTSQEIASGHADGTIRLRTNDDFRVTATLIAHSKAVLCLLESRGNFLISGSSDNSVRVWSLETKECLSSLLSHTKAVTCLLELGDARIASGSKDMSIHIRSPIKFTLEAIIKRKEPIYSLIQMTDNTIAYSMTKKIELWNIKKNLFIKNVTHTKFDVIPMMKRINQHNIICCSKFHIFLFDVAFNNCLFHYQDPSEEPIQYMLLLPNYQVAYTSSSPEIKTVDLMKELRTCKIRAIVMVNDSPFEIK